jgi:hypothetical protein
VNHETHARAEQLMSQERIEGLSQIERAWLVAHLQDCTDCAERARQTEHAMRAMRTAAIPLPPGLARRTQFRVRLRAQELREREPRLRALWLACAVSWAFGIASAPYAWRLFRWMGESTGAPKLVWELGFGLWWTIPAIFFVVVVLTEKLRPRRESHWMPQSR